MTMGMYIWCQAVTRWWSWKYDSLVSCRYELMKLKIRFVHVCLIPLPSLPDVTPCPEYQLTRTVLSVMFLIGFHNRLLVIIPIGASTLASLSGAHIFYAKLDTWQKPTLIQNHQSFWRCVKCCAVCNVLIAGVHHMGVVALTIISNSTSKDSIFYTRSTNFLRMGMKSMNRRASGNCLLSSPVLKLALCQQRYVD